MNFGGIVMLKTLSSLLSTFFFFAVIAVVLVISSLWKYAGELPDYHQLAKYEPAVTTRLYAGDGQLRLKNVFSFRLTRFPIRSKMPLSPQKTKSFTAIRGLIMSVSFAPFSAI